MRRCRSKALTQKRDTATQASELPAAPYARFLLSGPDILSIFSVCAPPGLIHVVLIGHELDRTKEGGTLLQKGGLDAAYAKGAKSL